MIASTYPVGFNAIAADIFRGCNIVPFGFKRPPVTNVSAFHRS